MLPEDPARSQESCRHLRIFTHGQSTRAALWCSLKTTARRGNGKFTKFTTSLSKMTKNRRGRCQERGWGVQQCVQRCLCPPPICWAAAGTALLSSVCTALWAQLLTFPTVPLQRCLLTKYPFRLIVKDQITGKYFYLTVYYFSIVPLLHI